MTEMEFIEHLATKVKEFDSVRQAAQSWGITDAYLGYILHGQRTPGPKVLEALGWEVVKEYRKK